MMLKVSVSEKGGEERELFFEDEEISIGRLQGNSVVLPKPNVSKRHATLIFRDGKASIVDQKSTNGTYVNGRRISSPRDLEPDDRIYIGDFTLRCNTANAEEDSESDVQVESMSADEQHKATTAMPAMPPMPDSEELSNEGPLPLDLDVEIVTEEVTGESSSEPPPRPQEEESKKTEFKTPSIPQELLDEAAAAVENIHREKKAAQDPAPEVEVALPDIPDDISVESAVETGREESGPGDSSAPISASSGLSERLKKVVKKDDDEDDDLHLEALRIVAAHAADTIFASVDPGRSDFPDDEWKELSDSVLRLVDKLRQGQSIPSEVNPYPLSQDLLYEFTGLGPLEEVLGDEEIRRVTVNGLENIFSIKADGTKKLGRSFVSRETLERVIIKLANLAGIPFDDDKTIMEGRLPDGTFLAVYRSPIVSNDTVLVFERPGDSGLAATDLMESGVVSESMMERISDAVREHLNVLVCGEPGSGRAAFLNAVAREIPKDDRVVVIERGKRLDLPHEDIVNLNKDQLSGGRDQGQGPCVAMRMFPDVMVVSELDADDAPLLKSIGLSMHKGVVASTTAFSPEDCIKRLELYLSFRYPASGSSDIHTTVRRALDLIVFLGPDDEGQPGVRGLFEFGGKGKLRQVEA